MKLAVVVGGFSERESVLNPFCEALYQLGIVEEAVPFTFKRALKDEHYAEKLEKASKKQLLITHSAGAMAVNSWMNPELFICYNGPEPRNIALLGLKGVLNTTGHFVKAAIGPHRAGHWRAGVSAVVHMPDDLPMLPSISQFSTNELVNNVANSGIPVINVLAGKDIYFATKAEDIPANSRVNYKLFPDWRHDDPLVRPYEVVTATFLEAA